jgi:hypothetical protein
MRNRSWLAGLASKIFPRRFAAARRTTRRRRTHFLGSLSLGSLSGEPLESLCRTLKMRTSRINTYFGRNKLTPILCRDYPVCEGFLSGKGTEVPRRPILDEILHPHILSLARSTSCLGPTNICLRTVSCLRIVFRYPLLQRLRHPRESAFVALGAAPAGISPFCLPDLPAPPSTSSV